MYLVSIIIISSILGWLVLPYAIRRFQQAILKRKCRMSRTIVLTYDDGPSAELTKKILALLKAYDVRATFFMLGNKVTADLGMPHMLVQAGHEIGSHSFQHLNAWKRSPLAVYRDIKRGLVEIRAFGKPLLFRPPHGKVTLATMLQVWFNQCRHAWWTIDSTDTWPTPMPIEGVVDRIRRDGGGVILMHDHSRPNNPEREAYVLELTKCILELARKEKFKLCRMSEIFLSNYNSLEQA